MNAASYYIQKITVKDGEPIEDILQRGVEQLRGLQEKATVQLRLLAVAAGENQRGSSRRAIYSLALTPAGAFLQRESGRPTLVIITTAGVFYRMAKGSYSPLQAYLDGDMQLLGNIDLAKRILVHLAGLSTDADAIKALANTCPVQLYNPIWQLDPTLPGYGSLTLSGKNFWPNGSVFLFYDWGSGDTNLTTRADSSGGFTLTARFIPCGAIPNRGGAGVIVTATDDTTQSTTQQSYSTPCQ
jgi:hypothetical protein